MVLWQDKGPDLFSVRYQSGEGLDAAGLRTRWDVIQHPWFQNLNTGKGQQPVSGPGIAIGRMVKCRDCADLVDGHAVECGIVAQHQGGEGMIPAMGAVGFFQVEIKNNVGVDDHKGVCIPEIRHVPDGSSGAQYERFVVSVNRQRVFFGGDKSLDFMVQMMGVDHNRRTTGMD